MLVSGILLLKRGIKKMSGRRKKNKEKVEKLSEKILIFCNEFIKDNNGTQAAIRAGYSPKSASSTATRLLARNDVQQQISILHEQINTNSICTKEQTLIILSNILTNNKKYIHEEVVCIENICKGVSQAKIINKGVSNADRIKAGKLLLQYYATTEDNNEEEIEYDEDIYE